MNEQHPTEDELAEEAIRWDSGELTPSGWQNAPEAVPREKESVAISIRLPRRMVAILKEFARRSGIGYQVLMKRWLDDRIRQEHERVKAEAARARAEAASRASVIRLHSPSLFSQAASFDATGITHPRGSGGPGG
jgi:hypothetical protein